MRHWPKLCSIICWWTTALAATPSATFRLREQLGQDYGQQLVSFPVPSDGVNGASILVGPEGITTYQLAEGDIWFVAAPISAGETVEYQLQTDSSQSASSLAQLTIQKTENSIEVSTGLIAARFPLAQSETTPQPPLLGLKLGEGSWSPASQWRNPQPIQRWSSIVLEEGPVFVRLKITYQLDDQSFASFTATIIAGDSAIRWRIAVSGDYPDTEAVFSLATMPGVKQVLLPKGYGQWAKADRHARTTTVPTGFLQLSPNTSLLNLFPDTPSQVVFENNQATLELASGAPGDWVTPGPQQTYFGQLSWSLPMIGQMWLGWRAGGMPIVYGNGGEISLIANFRRGVREWHISSGAPQVGTQLAEINALTLDWPESAKHPLLFLDSSEIERARETQPATQLVGRWAADALALGQLGSASKPAQKVVEQLDKQLSLLGNYDVMRQGIATAGLYDALIDSGWLTPELRQRFRAQMAYLGYVLADPMCWSSERGYGSGNPNMHCSYILTLGVVACVLRDHPMSATWANYASNWLDHWLETEVGPAGEWIPEGSHYGNVSLEVIVSFAIASQRAGYRDFTTDPRLKKLIGFFARMHTPPDPERGDRRATAAYGRGTPAEQLATIGLAARMTAQSDPEFSAEMQSIWAQMGYPNKIGDFRMGGFVGYYLDRDLPQTSPNWGSEQFPEFGAVFRSAYNTPQESFVNILAGVGSERNLDVWTPSVTDIAQWFARGKPISTCFTFLLGTHDRHELVSEGVQLARNYQSGQNGQPFGYYSTTDFSAFATLPGLDYARTRRVNTKRDDRTWLPPNLPNYPPVKAAKGIDLTIDRQFIFLREVAPEAPAYLVVRDTTTGGEPTVWQFWTLSEGLYASDAAQSEAVGAVIQPARQLPSGSRYTAKGQFGVDLEYFVAAPEKTPRYTLRYGDKIQHEQDRTQYQDLLHLQLPGDGAYFVALYPRLNEPAPTFATDRTQHVIRVDLAQGRDYVFLSDDDSKASLDEASFRGTAGAAKQRGGDQVLILGASGEAQLGKMQLSAPFPIALEVAQGRLTLTTADNCPGGTVRIEAPGKWSRVKARIGPADFKDSLELALPAGGGEIIYEAK